jgi:hypothetical protein
VGRVLPILKEPAVLHGELTHGLEKHVVPFPIPGPVEINRDLTEPNDLCARESIHVDGPA